MKNFEPIFHALCAAGEMNSGGSVNVTAQRLHHPCKAVGAAHRTKIPDEVVEAAVTHVEAINIDDDIAQSRSVQQGAQCGWIEHGMKAPCRAAASALGIE